MDMNQPGLSVDQISRRYGETVALEDLSLEVGRGQIFGFVGPNGAGKTTAMRIIVGLLQADSGTVTWNGAPISTDQRRRIGYMPEERGLYPKMRVDQQLEFFAELHGLEATEASARTAAWLDRLGVGERATDNVEELSLGNQQRVQLAASLVFDPEILVLDEPFSGLDPVGVDALSEVLVEVCADRGVPVLFSSHQLELVERLCDSVAIIKAGRLVAAGPVAELERERSGNTWTIELEGQPESWQPELEGLRRLGPWTFELDEGTDPQALLEAGQSAGQVRRFGQVEPGLAELFRSVVSEH